MDQTSVTAEPKASAPLAETDELLSQLAGEEIDRLLAEADKDAEADPVAPVAAAVAPELSGDSLHSPLIDDASTSPPVGEQGAASPSGPERSETEEQIDELCRALTTGDAPTAGALNDVEVDQLLRTMAPAGQAGVAAAPGEATSSSPAKATAAAPAGPLSPGADPELESELSKDEMDQLLKQVDTQGLGAADPPVEPMPAAPELPPADKASPGAMAGMLETLEVQQATVKQELAAQAPAGGAAARTAVAAEAQRLLSIARQKKPKPKATTADGSSAAALAWLARPLEVINSPLAGMSDERRELMGKVAVILLINALAVLLYVAFLA